MAVLDAYIQEVAKYVENIQKKDLPLKAFSCRKSLDEIRDELPVRVGPRDKPDIILRGETFAELGNPLAGSCAFVLWTDSPSLINDGKITLIGPDIPESAGASLPFGQVLLIGGKELQDQDHESLLQFQYVSDQIEGYMIKSAPDRVWTRVGKKAAEKGFDFETLGKALMGICKSEEPRVEAMEILFVTSSKEDVNQLDSLAVQINKISRDIIKENWKVRGYDIECASDCSSCGEKVVCDNIKDVIAVRKKDKREAEKKK